MKNPFFILSVDGGGMRGYVAAAIIAEIERRTGRKAWQMFNMAAGTSIGGIIASIVASGGSGQDILRFFHDSAPKIFKKGPWWNRNGFFGARYPAAAIEQALISALAHQTMKSTKIELLVPCFDLNSGSPVVFKTTDPQFDLLELWEIARGTSAAQSYFPAFALDQWMLWDGGNVANHPGACAMAEAHRHFEEKRIVMLSIGCGQTPEKFRWRTAPGWGLLEVAAATFKINMETGAEIADYQCAELLGEDYIRINPVINNVELDDASPAGIRELQSSAALAIQSHAVELDRIVEMLK